MRRWTILADGRTFRLLHDGRLTDRVFASARQAERVAADLMESDLEGATARIVDPADVGLLGHLR